MNSADDDRPFPPESEWLELSLPTYEQPTHQQGSASSTGDIVGGTAFVDRVLQALAAEQELDRQMQQLDRELPTELLQQFTVPAPSRQFADRTAQAMAEARRQRWQQLLARHVAPEPSPQFVARTLEALAADRGLSADGNRRHRRASVAQDGRAHAKVAPRWSRGLLPLVAAAAAAAAIVWFAVPRAPRLPLEQRLVATTSPAFAFRHGSSPLAAVLAEVADAAEPFALPAAGADGLWLSVAEAR